MKVYAILSVRQLRAITKFSEKRARKFRGKGESILPGTICLTTEVIMDDSLKSSDGAHQLSTGLMMIDNETLGQITYHPKETEAKQAA